MPVKCRVQPLAGRGAGSTPARMVERPRSVRPGGDRPALPTEARTWTAVARARPVGTDMRRAAELAARGRDDFRAGPAAPRRAEPTSVGAMPAVVDAILGVPRPRSSRRPLAANLPPAGTMRRRPRRLRGRTGAVVRPGRQTTRMNRERCGPPRAPAPCRHGQRGCPDGRAGQATRLGLTPTDRHNRESVRRTALARAGERRSRIAVLSQLGERRTRKAMIA
jgi:hypothetical protein